MGNENFDLNRYLIGKLKKIDRKLTIIGKHFGLNFEEEEKKKKKPKGLEMYPSVEEILDEKFKKNEGSQKTN
jgi:hypothetical protein